MPNIPEPPSFAAGVMSYGPTVSPAVRVALNVILPTPNSLAMKPLLVVVRVGSGKPTVFVILSAVTEAGLTVMLPDEKVFIVY